MLFGVVRRWQIGCDSLTVAQTVLLMLLLRVVLIPHIVIRGGRVLLVLGIETLAVRRGLGLHGGGLL
jgi:hypothetical protein